MRFDRGERALFHDKVKSLKSTGVGVLFCKLNEIYKPNVTFMKWEELYVFLYQRIQLRHFQNRFISIDVPYVPKGVPKLAYDLESGL